MSDEPHRKSQETEAGNGRHDPCGGDVEMERGFAALRELCDSTKREGLPPRIRIVMERLRRQD